MAGHALLSASGSKRWMACPPSARLEERFEDKTSVFALEGTLAHEYAELELSKAFLCSPAVERNYKGQLSEIKSHELYNPEMAGYMEAFKAYISEELLDAKKRDDNYYLGLEVTLDYSDFVPEGFGTGDVIIIADGILKIIDLKYGKGVMVESKDNSQMKLYALGAILAYGMVYDIDTVEMTIYQPRLDNISSHCISARDLLNWAETELKEKALLAWDGAGKFCPGDHCKFCKAKATCRALAEENLKLQQYDYKDPNLLSLAEIGDIIKIADRLKSWTESVKAHALDEALDGKKIEGFKVVEGRSNRSYTDTGAIEKALRRLKYKVSDIYEKKLIGVSKMEKLLGKQKFNSAIGEYVVKPPGKPTLVPITDKRPEFVSAEVDFKDVDVSKL